MLKSCQNMTIRLCRTNGVYVVMLREGAIHHLNILNKTSCQKKVLKKINRVRIC